MHVCMHAEWSSMHAHMHAVHTHQLLSLLCVGVGEYCQVYTCPMMGNQVKGFPRGGCLETLWSADGRKELLPTRLLIALNNKAVLQLHSLSLSLLPPHPPPLSRLSVSLSLSVTLGTMLTKQDHPSGQKRIMRLCTIVPLSSSIDQWIKRRLAPIGPPVLLLHSVDVKRYAERKATNISIFCTHHKTVLFLMEQRMS